MTKEDRPAAIAVKTKGIKHILGVLSASYTFLVFFPGMTDRFAAAEASYWYNHFQSPVGFLSFCTSLSVSVGFSGLFPSDITDKKSSIIVKESVLVTAIMLHKRP